MTLHPDDVSTVSQMLRDELPAVHGYPVDHLSRQIITMLDAARANRLSAEVAERAACELIALRHRDLCPLGVGASWSACNDIAAAIRARGKEPPA